jgi:5-methylthioadenosine/S-adenosylhomocysteine deaminase
MITLYCAKWVLPIIAAPISDGAVAVEGARIASVGPRAALAEKFAGARLCDLGTAAILPGLVNCHSHLELTAMRGFLEREERDFFAWLRKLTVTRLELMTPDDLRVAAMWGAVEAARAGVTCLGDASDNAGASLSALAEAGLRGVVYQEVFGPDRNLVRERLQELQDKIAALRSLETDRVRVGVSPHAPYTVSAPLLESVTDYAIAEELPVMIHAAESAAETWFMRDGSGPFADSLRQRGIEWQAPGLSTVQYLASLGVLRARPLLAHCVTVDDTDIAALRDTRTRVAHCPKSNAKFGHGRAPYAAFIRSGVAVGFGSDSVASNNTCDMLEEARFAALLARAGPEAADGRELLSADRALHDATRGGALALGLNQQIGALAEGWQADLAVVSLAGAHQLPVYDPVAALVFASSGRDVIMTVVAGREVYRDGRVVTVDEERLGARMREINRKLAGAQ